MAKIPTNTAINQSADQPVKICYITILVPQQMPKLQFVRYFFLVFILLSGLSVHVSAQQFYQTPNATVYIKKKGDPDVTPQTLAQLSKLQAQSTQSATKRYIVRFKNNPIFKKVNGSVASRVQDAEAPHLQFQNDLKRVAGKAGRSSGGPVVSHKFTKVFNGVALTGSQAHVEEIKKLDYVASVTEDRILKVVDDQTNGIIGADQVWSQFATRGEGIKIGIIDTGIDYNHEALGGGLGAGFKVIGGYDFVNNDNDPMDDHGHGTHVAGIAAADGTILKGVAPGALLIAYKVFDASGSGYDSDIIRAIELAVDPDGNPATNDQLDVLNMSLGGDALPAGFDDPLVDAVENAISHGITICIAAGNSGSTTNAIKSPGIAEHAITVGATDNTDAIAPFSSVGPSPGYYLKPDLVAPGVSVNSAFPGGGYKLLSGTSMATPHVAGCVALLKSLHSQWSPEILKGTLMASAKELNVNIWAEGKGRVDVLKAAQSQFVVTPGSVSIGQVDLSQAVWNKTYTFALTNLSHQPIAISLKLDGDFNQPGVTGTLSTTTILLAGDETKNIDLPISINTATLPKIHLGESYKAKLICSSDTQSNTVPITFVNYGLTQFYFEDRIPPLLLIVGSDSVSKGYSSFISPVADNLSLILPFGAFAMVAFYDESARWVVKDGITPSSSVIIFNPAEATHRLVLNVVDEKNKIIHGRNTITWVKRNYDFGQFGAIFSAEKDTLYFSTISSGFTASVKLNSFVTPEKDRFYDAEAVKEGSITADAYVTNDPAAYQQINYNIGDGSSLYPLKYYVPPGTNGLADSTNKNFKFFMTERDQASYLYQSYFSIVRNDITWQTAAVSTFRNDSISFASVYNNSSYPKSIEFNQVRSANPFNFNFGQSLLRPGDFISFDYSTNQIGFTPPSSSGQFIHAFGERERGMVHTEVLSSNSLIVRDSVPNSFAGDVVQKNSPLSGGQLTFRATYEDYSVQGQAGKASVELTRNAGTYPYPYSLKSLNLKVGGISTDQIEPGDAALIDFDVKSYGSFGDDQKRQSKLFIRKTGDSVWTALTVTLPPGKSPSAVVPSTLPPGFYSLKFSGSDILGLTMNYIAEPAFRVGSVTKAKLPISTAILPLENATVSKNPSLNWVDIGGALGYSLEISKTKDFSKVDGTFNSWLTSYQFSDLLDANTTYYWRVQAKYSKSSGRWSSVASFRTNDQISLAPPILLKPNAISQRMSNDMFFQWNKSAPATRYRIEVSALYDFSLPLVDEVVVDTFLVVRALPSTTPLYWRAKSISGSNESDWSTVVPFNAIFGEPTEPPQTLNLHNPTNFASDQLLQIVFDWDDIGADYYVFQLSQNLDLSMASSDTLTITSITMSALIPRTEYYWKVYGVKKGILSGSQTFTFSTGIKNVTGIQPKSEEPFVVFPNPTSSTLKIQYENYKEDRVSLTVLNMLGEVVSVLQDGSVMSGEQTIQWDLRTADNARVPDGVYLIRLTKGSQHYSKRVVVGK